MATMRFRFLLAVAFALVLSLTSVFAISPSSRIAETCPEQKSVGTASDDGGDDLSRWDSFLPGMFK